VSNDIKDHATIIQAHARPVKGLKSGTKTFSVLLAKSIDQRLIESLIKKNEIVDGIIND